ncbi:rhamnogalacturonan acetylesterase [Chitinophagaceae bacterium LB-8]|uniref:Rhamnogalacturonan acetylesterase n=1 Tax=Paraflavisolibacter caeni TaxID=2982496 RepID=A0A9X2XNA9_9BACT|nr:rhamnogalacturonan acetylesterase [Paraflavisolibacter caeni]MCU7547799.1 rhamnogalacturonan acetylesterase [Paraflavisolibacter caeni]
MSHRFFKVFGLFSVLFLLSFTMAPRKIKVYLIGDSTMSIKQSKAYPETGWGMPFVYFFDSTVEVDNRAQNGRSTRTFIEEGRWQPVTENLQAGDYVFIQFGHNDEVPTKKSYTTEDAFKANLAKFINETRAKKATPVLITPAARRSFDSTTGKIKGTHDIYSALVRSVAVAYKTPLIDLDKQSQDLLQSFGVEGSRLLFNQLKPGEHPNYPKGVEDNTHFNELGARKMAQIVLADIKDLKLELADRIVNSGVKK